MVVEVFYWGSWGDHLAVSQNLQGLPAQYWNAPMAVIEAEPGEFQTVGAPGHQFALLRPARIGLPYVSVRFLGFINAPAGYRTYAGPPVT